MSHRRKFLAGNWKMHGDKSTVRHLASAIVDRIGTVTDVDIAVCPTFLHLADVHEIVGGTSIGLGAQNLYVGKEGAFTGEVSAAMLAEIGCKYVIVGHSERRHILKEDDEIINRKLMSAIQASLRPILCVGEQLADRDAGRTFDIVSSQLRNGLVGVPLEELRSITIAYEPVWAIGTGKVATPEQAEEVHQFIRETLTKQFGADIAQNMCLQYGGSVKADNAEGLLRQPNIDGALIGGASLKVDEFVAIVQAGVKVSKN